MIAVTVKSKKTGEVKTEVYTGRELLETYEDDLVSNLTQCDCPLSPESNELDCCCCDDWEEYEIFFCDESREGAE
ncbi:hypothetical protein GXP75_18835 [Bacillus sp. HU-1818]|uniref:hypothetical protein n=1 Tax=Bacillus sp. HU-1818 TaxID=2704469 RepID=UPI001F5D17A1|nr:hypothetical protein [Bacillus sp. HU-1818]MCI3197685.1 hypothetical protein [Bacillus sp. HU-1818]